MLVLYVTLLKGQGGECSRAMAKQFLETGGEGVKDVMSADVQADQGLTVEAVGQVRHVQTVQVAVGHLQALQWSVEGAGLRKKRHRGEKWC